MAKRRKKKKKGKKKGKKKKKISWAFFKEMRLLFFYERGGVFYPEVSILTTVCGGVSCAKPHLNPINNGIMLVGDAAHQINPMTGGGIASGMKGGQIAGKVAVKSLEKQDYSKKFLKKYPKLMFKNFGNNHNRFYRIKETINDLEDQDLDYIANKVSKVPANKRTLSTVFKHAVFKKPSILIDVAKVFVGI